MEIIVNMKQQVHKKVSIINLNLLVMRALSALCAHHEIHCDKSTKA